MDPTFAALLDELRGQGFTDNVFNWLAGLSSDEWGTRVRQIQAWMANLTPEQKSLFVTLPSYADAERFIGTGPSGTPTTPAAPTTPTTPTAPATTPLPNQPVSVPSNTPTNTPTSTPSKNDGAFAIIRQMLDSMGLGGLADWAWRRYQEGASLDTITIELYQRPEFKAQYPEYEELAKRGRAYSVAELQAYRKAVVGIFRSYGIPESFYDQPGDLARFAASEVSIAEISKRVSMAAEAVYQSSPMFRSEMERMYGVGNGDLVAFFLDPDKAEPLIRQKYVSAQIGGAARQTNYGTLTVDEAERLQGLGVDAQRASEGFSVLARSQELFNPVSMSESQIGRDVQLGAAFGGDATAQQTVERRRGQRLAEFAKGGGYATNREGIAGV